MKGVYINKELLYKHFDNYLFKVNNGFNYLEERLEIEKYCNKKMHKYLDIYKTRIKEI